MRKIYSLMMMLAMMVAALSFNACSSSDDDGDGIDVKKDDKYITIKFDSFTFESHTLNGTVQLSFDED